MHAVKYPEKLAALNERRALRVAEAAIARADYQRKQQQAHDQLRKLREARVARERILRAGVA